MVISRTPYRISFFGGGTDYPAWYTNNGGQVLSTTIDKFLYISCRYLPPFFDHRLRLAYSTIEVCKNLDELVHPSARETLRYLKMDSGLEMHYDGDLPGRCGVGSSSAFTVGLLNALYAFNGEIISARRLARETIHIEQVMVGEQVGSQDQISAAYGGLNKIEFSRDGKISVRPILANQSRIDHLNQNLMLFFTGIMRTAGDIAATFVDDITARSSQLNKIYSMVDDAIDILYGPGDLDDFGRLLHEAWLEKRSLSPEISNPFIDELYRVARSSGAIGGKITGAGGGGMLLLYVPIHDQAKVKEMLSDLLYIPFRFEPSGSEIIFRTGDLWYEEQERWQLAEGNFS